MTACRWETAGLTAEGNELDVLSLWFGGQEAAISATYYEPLEILNQDAQDYYLTNETETLYEFEGKKYVPKGMGDERPMEAEEQGDTVIISIMEEEVTGKITMVRSAADQYTITQIEGRIIDNIVTSCLKVGSVFTVKG